MLHASSNKVVINANFINNNKNLTKVKKKLIQQNGSRITIKALKIK